MIVLIEHRQQFISALKIAPWSYLSCLESQSGSFVASEDQRKRLDNNPQDSTLFCIALISLQIIGWTSWDKLGQYIQTDTHQAWNIYIRYKCVHDTVQILYWRGSAKAARVVGVLYTKGTTDPFLAITANFVATVDLHRVPQTLHIYRGRSLRILEGDLSLTTRCSDFSACASPDKSISLRMSSQLHSQFGVTCQPRHLQCTG